MISDPAAPTPAPISVLRVPDTARAFLFELDAVLTQTAQQHAVPDVVVGDLAEPLDRP